jgi:hypothetical protein
MITAEDMIALQQLDNAYWALADGTEDVAISDLFLADGVLELGGLKLEGAAVIEAFFRERAEEQRASGRITRHFAANFRAVPVDADTVRTRTNVMVFAGSGALPLDAGAPANIGDFEAVCVRMQKGQWRFRHKSVRTIFVGEGAAKFAR